MVLAVKRIDEAVTGELVHAHAGHAGEVELLQARLALVVLLHVPRLQRYPPVRLVHVHRQAADRESWLCTVVAAWVEGTRQGATVVLFTFTTDPSSCKENLRSTAKYIARRIWSASTKTVEITRSKQAL